MSSASDSAGAHSYEGLGLRPFTAALSSGILLFLIQLTIFFLVRRRKLLYHFFYPKDAVDTSLHEPLLTMWNIGETNFIGQNGLDAYFFQRYLRTMTFMFVPVAAIVTPVLIALNYSGGAGKNIIDGLPSGGSATETPQGLDTLAWGNITKENTKRYWAHLVFAEIIIIWVCALVYKELEVCASTRQKYLGCGDSSPYNRAVLVGNIPPELDSKVKLRMFFETRCGEVEDARFLEDMRWLRDKIETRDYRVDMLEVAETKRVIMRQKRRRRQTTTFQPKNSRDETQSGRVDPSDGTECPSHKLQHIRWCIPRCLESLAFWPYTDTTSWWRDRLYETIDDMDKQIKEKGPDMTPPTNTALVVFKDLTSAQTACQVILSDRPRFMTPRIAGVDSRDVIWHNVNISWMAGCARSAAVHAILCFMLVFWAVPVAWIAALANIDSLSQTLGFLNWIRRDGRAREVAGILSGILPPALLSLVLAIIPLLLEFLAIVQGVRTRSQQASFVQRFYFAFLFVQIFLIVSVTSFFSSSAGQLWRNIQTANSVDAVANILAANLPKAANYFFSHMALNALSSSAATLLRPTEVLLHLVRPFLVQDTPRRKSDRLNCTPRMNLSHVFPGYTVFACISLAYSVVAPLISFLAVALFGLAWIAQTHNIIFVSSDSTYSLGTLYPRALFQTFFGLYVMELLLMGLFVSQANHSSSARLQSAVMLGTFASTILYQILLKRTFAPFFSYINPKSHRGEAAIPPAGLWFVDLFPTCFNVEKPLIVIPRGEDESQGQEVNDRLEYSSSGSFVTNGRVILDTEVPAFSSR